MPPRQKTNITKARQLNKTKQTKGRVLRKAGFWFKSILKPDGEITIDIDAIDSQIKHTGKQEILDVVYGMVKLHIYDQVDNINEGLDGAVRIREERETAFDVLATENVKLRVQLEQFRKLALSIQSGIAGNPATPAKEIKLKIFNILKIGK